MKVVPLRRLEGPVICENCFVADRALARMRGLLGRKSLEQGEGMLLRRASSVHTFFMRFAIDVVFLDRNDTVVGIERELRPWRTARRRGAKAVLELPAGAAAEARLAEGDRLASSRAA